MRHTAAHAVGAHADRQRGAADQQRRQAVGENRGVQAGADGVVKVLYRLENKHQRGGNWRERLQRHRHLVRDGGQTPARTPRGEKSASQTGDQAAEDAELHQTDHEVLHVAGDLIAARERQRGKVKGQHHRRQRGQGDRRGKEAAAQPPFRHLVDADPGEELFAVAASQRHHQHRRQQPGDGAETVARLPRQRGGVLQILQEAVDFLVIQILLHKQRRPEARTENTAGVKRQLGFHQIAAQVGDLRREHQGAVFNALRLLNLIVQLALLRLQRAALAGHFRRLFHAAVRFRRGAQHRQLRVELLTLRLQRLRKRIGVARQLQRQLVKLRQLVFVGLSRHLTFDLVEDLLHFRQFNRRVHFGRGVSLLRGIGRIVVCHAPGGEQRRRQQHQQR